MKRNFVGKKALTFAFAVGLAVFTPFATPIHSGIFEIEAEAATESGIPQYRLYNPNSGEHFYTQNSAERNHLVSVGWTYEGYAWMASHKNVHPVYRLYNPNAGDHHYTMNSGERDTLVRLGWRYEGTGWYSDQAHGKAVYRLYNPNARAGAHHYTLSSVERDALVRLGWRYEGVSFYAVNANTPKDDTASVNEKYAPLEDTYYTSILNSREKAVAKEVLAKIKRGGSGSWESSNVESKASAERVYRAVESVYAPCGGNTVVGWYEGDEYGVYVSDIGAAHRIYQQNQSDLNRIRAFITPYTNGKNEAQKVRAIHDRIVNYLEYDNSFHNYSWKSGLNTHYGVCQSYAELFHLCAMVSGLQDRIVIGTADGDGGWGGHAWNLVRVNGTWYYIDVCWDDSLRSNQYYLSRGLWNDHRYESDVSSGTAA